MDIVITESQKNRIILESKTQEIPFKIKKAKSFATKVLNDVKKQISNDLKFILTWGSSIGGIMHPLNEFINGEYPELTQLDVSLIIVGAVSIVFFNNTEVYKEIKNIVKEKNIIQALISAINKTEELKEVFYKFINGLNLSLHQMTNIISYAFIIPILPSIYEMVSNQEFSSGQVEIIIKRIIASVSVALSGILVKELIEKLIKRFSGKE
jgi:hypothetical protein